MVSVETYSLSVDFTNQGVNAETFEDEILSSSISSATLEFINVSVSSADNVDIVFDVAISAGDKTTLDGLVAAHLGEVVIESFIDGSIKDFLAVAPTNPRHGDRYIVAIGATGIWDGYDTFEAQFNDVLSEWEFFKPAVGVRTLVESDNRFYFFNGIIWRLLPHADRRELIHLADGVGGPFEDFLSGAFREILPANDPFPTSVIWWESSATLEKIVEKTITRNANKTPSTIEWKAYDEDGYVEATVTDSITYGVGIFEINRTRTVS